VTGPVFHSVAAVEFDEAAAATYQANFGNTSSEEPRVGTTKVFQNDITRWNLEGEHFNQDSEIDVVVGGPPCQGFSALNWRKVGPERNQLWEHYLRVVSQVEPKIFVIENVDRFVRSPEFEDLNERLRSDDVLRKYELALPPGFDDELPPKRARRYLLNSANYGAPQARRRAIVIGVHEDVWERVGPDRSIYPAATHEEAPRLRPGRDKLKRWVSVDEVFKESEALGEIVRFAVPEAPGPYPTHGLHFGREPVEMSRARYAAIPEGGNRKDLEGCWYLPESDPFVIVRKNPDGKYEVIRGEDNQLGQVVSAEVFSEMKDRFVYLSTESWDKHKSGAGDVMGRLRSGRPSVTIRTEFFKPEKGRYLHPKEDRPITHYEAARIQGFPLDFKWCGSKVAIARQIGNAVPIPLGRAIAGAIYQVLRGTEAN
jgi:DNA (cytosine-5)-methyltransferase 1